MDAAAALPVPPFPGVPAVHPQRVTRASDSHGIPFGEGCECPGRGCEPQLTAVSLLQAVPAKGETKQDLCLKTELLREEGKGTGRSWASSDCT